MLSVWNYKGIDLYDAVDEGNKTSVKNVLRGIPTDKKVDILIVKRWNVGTIIHLAVKRNQTEIIKCLIEGVTPDQRVNILKIQNNDQKTAVHIAAEEGNTDTISYLLEGIPLDQRLEIFNSKSLFHGTPLHCASNGGHVYTVKYILGQITSDKRLTIIKKRNNRVHCSMDTAIHLAAKGGHTEVLRCLFDALPAAQWLHTLKMQNKINETAVHLAAKGGHTGVLRYILDPLSDDQRLNIIKMQNKDKETTIHLAAKGGHVDTIKYLLEAISDDLRLDILSIQNGDGNTAVHYEMSAKFHNNCSEYLGIVRCLMKLLQPRQQLTLLKISNHSGKKIIETYPSKMESTVGEYLKKCKADAEKKIIKVNQDAKSDEFSREQEKERRGSTGLCKSTKIKNTFTKINIGLMSYQNGKFCKQSGKVEIVEVSASDDAAAVRAKAKKKHRKNNQSFVEASYKLRYPNGKLVEKQLPLTGKAFCVRSYAQHMKKKSEDLTLYLSANNLSNSDPPAKVSNIKNKVSAPSSSISTSSASNEKKGRKRSSNLKSLETSKKSKRRRLTGETIPAGAESMSSTQTFKGSVGYDSSGERIITIKIKKEPTAFPFNDSQTVEWLITQIRKDSGENLPCRILDHAGVKYSKTFRLENVRLPFTVIVGNVETLITDGEYVH